MYKLIKSETKRVSPRRAEEFLKSNTFPGQRNQSREWVQNLATKMSDGTFTKGHIAFASNGDEKMTMMNGQHQCKACVLSDKEFLSGIDYYECPSESDFWHLFSTFDTHRQRTEANVMKAARGLFASEPLQSVPLRILSNCGSALLFLQDGTTPAFATKAASKADKAELVEKFECDVITIASYGLQHIHVAVICAMIATHRVNDAKAREFWERVLYGDQLRKGTPQWNLCRQLNSTLPSNGGGNRNLYLYRLSILWWNAFVTGEKRVITKVRIMKTIPEVKGGKVTKR